MSDLGDTANETEPDGWAEEVRQGRRKRRQRVVIALLIALAISIASIVLGTAKHAHEATSASSPVGAKATP